MNILDITEVENDAQSLQSTFRSWLHDCGTDSEHLHLILPAPSPNTAGKHKGRSGGLNFDEDSDDDISDWRGYGCDSSVGVVKGHGGRSLVVKCDIQERILDPSTAFDAKISNQFVSLILCIGLFRGPTEFACSLCTYLLLLRSPLREVGVALSPLPVSPRTS